MRSSLLEFIVQHNGFLGGHLRAKLEADPSQPQHLVTELGVGYRFVP